MNLLTEIKYKKDSQESDIQLKVIVFTIFISLLIILLIRSVDIILICGVIILLEIIILGKKDGIVRLYEKDGIYEIAIANEGESEVYEKVTSCKYRWSYNSIEFIKGGGGTSKATHVNYIFIRIEFTLNNGKKIILGKELNQWNSAPSNWEYEVMITEGSEFFGITSHNLVKLKKEMELLTFSHS